MIKMCRFCLLYYEIESEYLNGTFALLTYSISCPLSLQKSSKMLYVTIKNTKLMTRSISHLNQDFLLLYNIGIQVLGKHISMMQTCVFVNLMKIILNELTLKLPMSVSIGTSMKTAVKIISTYPCIRKIQFYRSIYFILFFFLIRAKTILRTCIVCVTSFRSVQSFLRFFTIQCICERRTVFISIFISSRKIIIDIRYNLCTSMPVLNCFTIDCFQFFTSLSLSIGEG